MAIKFNKIKPGMVLLDIHSVPAGNTTMRRLGCWKVEIISVDWVNTTAVVRWNGNAPKTWSKRIEEFSPAQALALLDRIDRLERCLAAALDLCARGGGFPEDRAAIRKELSHAE